MMVQAWYKMDFGTGTVTFLDDTQKEDMLQVEYPNGFLLDMESRSAMANLKRTCHERKTISHPI